MNSEVADTKSVGESPSRVTGELRRRLMGWMMLIALLPITIMAAEGYFYGTQAVREKTDEHLRSVLASRRDLVDGWMRQRLAELKILTMSPSIARCCSHFTTLSENEIEHETTILLDAVVHGIVGYEHLGVYDTNWNLIAASGPSAVPSKEAIPQQVRDAITEADGFVLASPTVSASGDVVIHVGRPVQNAGGKVGALYAAINITKGITPLLHDRNGLGHSGKVYIVDRGGTILTEPIAGAPAVAFKKPAPAYITNVQAAPTEGVQEIYTNEAVDSGTQVLFGTTQIPNVDWTLVVEFDAREANQWLTVMARRTAVTALGTILVLFGVATWISGRLGKPLEELARVAQRIRQGHVNERLGPMSGAEAEEVRIAVNQMLDELRSKQAELVQSEKLASIGELTTSIVHEMRNPLSSVKMNLQAIRRRLADDANYAELADIATSQARRLEAMLDDLLSFGRPMKLTRKPLSFHRIAQHAVDSVAEQTQSNKIRITIVDKTKEATFLADEEYLCRTLTNLLMNAIQASPSNATVELVAECPEPRDGISIRVLDNGHGLSEEVLAHLFNPFYTTKPNGTGLGLFNVRKIAELHGGSIRAQNRRDGGAEFILHLPLEGN